MSIASSRLAALGWRAHHSQQVSLEELASLHAARIVSVHRDRLDAIADDGEIDVRALPADVPLSEWIAVGDWILLERDSHRFVRRLEAFSCLIRMAAGVSTRRQLIASNLDTLFIAMSCNEDFNLSRLERYVALAYEGGVTPVVVLTKADLHADVSTLIVEAQSVATGVDVVAFDARDRYAARVLEPWLAPGQTVACVGSSGVGKSTLINTLGGDRRQATGSIRADDDKGRHTTTARHLIAMPSGAWLIDTPGMRELKLGAAEAGLRAAFDDIEQLAARCKFRDCRHEGERGCAVSAAVNDGTLDRRRLENFRKLQREAMHANASLAERRERERRFGRMRHEMERVRKKMRGER